MSTYSFNQTATTIFENLRGADEPHIQTTIIPSHSHGMISPNETDIIILSLFSLVSILIIYQIWKTIMAQINLGNPDSLLAPSLSDTDIATALAHMSAEIAALNKVIRNKLKVKEIPAKKTITQKKPAPVKETKNGKRGKKAARDE